MMPRSPSRAASSLLAVLTVAAASTMVAGARAQPHDAQRMATAQSIFDDAVRLMNEGRFGDACPKLEEVVRLEPSGVGAKLQLAECYEGAGRLASAWTTYRIVEGAARAVGQPDRALKAEQRAAALKPRLAELVIDVASEIREAPDLIIMRDGIAVGAAQWGAAVPVDRGDHIVVARASRKRPFERRVRVDRDGQRVVVKIGALVDDVSAASNPSAGGASTRAATSPSRHDDPGSGRRLLGLVLGGAGLASIGVGGFFGVRALDKKGDAEAHCEPSTNLCDETGVALRSEGVDAGNLSTGFFAAGGALLAAGAIVFITSPSPTSNAGGIGRAWVVGLGPTGAQVIGRW